MTATFLNGIRSPAFQNIVSSYPNPKILTDEYFGKALKDYCFYKTAGDKTVSVCSSLTDGSCLQSGDDAFDAYAGKFYSYFVEESCNIVFSHNFAQQLEKCGQSLASLKTRDELEKALALHRDHGTTGLLSQVITELHDKKIPHGVMDSLIPPEKLVLITRKGFQICPPFLFRESGHIFFAA